MSKPAPSTAPTPADPPPTYTTTSLPSRPLPRPPPLSTSPFPFLQTARILLASSSPRRRHLLAQLGVHGPNLIVRPSGHPEDLPKHLLSPFEYVLQTATAKCLAAYEAALQNHAEPDPELVIAADTVVVARNGEVLEKPRSEREHVAMLRALRDGGGGSKVSGGTQAQAQAPAVAGPVEDTLLDGLVGPGMRGENLGGDKIPEPMTPQAAAAPAMTTSAGADVGWHRVYTAVAVLAPLASAKAPGYAMETAVEETRVKFAPDLTDDFILAYVRTREGADKAGGYGIQGAGALLVERIEGCHDNVVGLPLRTTVGVIEAVLKAAREDEDFEGDLLSGDEDGEGGSGGEDEAGLGERL